MDNSKQTKVVIIACISAFVAVVVGLIIWYVVASLDYANKKDTVGVTNLDDCSKNIHQDIRDDIYIKMYSFVKMANEYNKKNTAPSYVSEIRNGSCEEHKSTINGPDNTPVEVKTTSAILDIPSAGQSWKISYDWVPQGTEIEVDLGTVRPECLPKNELRYGDFNCEKVLGELTYGTDEFDPILKYMPYFGEGFTLNYDIKTKKVSAEIVIPLKEKNNSILINSNKDAVLYWFNYRNLDPKKYDISYSIKYE